MKKHSAGYITFLGKPNTGKSTLCNALSGEKLSIVTHKAQTTRHKILHIISDENYQMVLTDTPGVIDPAYPLQEKMMDFVLEGLKTSDIILYLIEMGEKEPSEQILDLLKKSEKPLVLVMNKVDISQNQEEFESELMRWKELIKPDFHIPVSALHKFNLEPLKNILISLLPEHPAFFPKENLSDMNTRFFISEIIRGQILERYQKEIPYACQVEIIKFDEEANPLTIAAEIHVERRSQKGIIIGQRGIAIKKLGESARRQIEQFIGCHIYLDLYVRVKENWRKDDKHLKNFGY